MIFLDANIFLRFLAPARDEINREKAEIAYGIFDRLERGEEDATTTEVVLHEVFFVLTSKKHYGLSVPDVIEIIAPILDLSGMRFEPGEKRVFQRALDILSDNPKLEFADSVIAARVERLGIPLATFDERLGSLPSITRWRP